MRFIPTCAVTLNSLRGSGRESPTGNHRECGRPARGSRGHFQRPASGPRLSKLSSRAALRKEPRTTEFCLGNLESNEKRSQASGPCGQLTARAGAAHPHQKRDLYSLGTCTQAGAEQGWMWAHAAPKQAAQDTRVSAMFPIKWGSQRQPSRNKPVSGTTLKMV